MSDHRRTNSPYIVLTRTSRHRKNTVPTDRQIKLIPYEYDLGKPYKCKLTRDLPPPNKVPKNNEFVRKCPMCPTYF